MTSIKQKIISFQGAEGANSDIVCRRMYPDWETLPCETFQDAFDAVKNGDATRGMIPIDNTLAGRVADVHHLLPQSEMQIIAEHFEPIRFALLGIPGAKIEELEHVHSHIHGLPQCRKIIKELGLKTHSNADTAGSARDVAAMNDPKHAALSPKLAAEIYGLDILREDVQDENHNTTRFVVVSKEDINITREEGQEYITSMMFRVRNIPAALYKALGGFATNGVNMLKLESYIDPKFQVAQFYVDVQGHKEDENIKLALDELKFFAAELNMFGSYKAHSFRSFE